QTVNLNDGCGGIVHPRFSTAVNGRNPNFNDTEWGLNSTRLMYNQFAPLIPQGLDVEDHSYRHISLSSLSAATVDVNNNRQMWYDNINYLMNTAVVPTNYSYYVQAWKNLNYFGAITQGA